MIRALLAANQLGLGLFVGFRAVTLDNAPTAYHWAAAAIALLCLATAGKLVLDRSAADLGRNERGSSR